MTEKKLRLQIAGTIGSVYAVTRLRMQHSIAANDFCKESCVVYCKFLNCTIDKRIVPAPGGAGTIYDLDIFKNRVVHKKTGPF